MELKTPSLLGKVLCLTSHVANIFLLLFLFLTLICVFVPFSPNMPSLGLDASWVIGMNEAIGRGFSIGKQIVFTFGPYSSVYTKHYHPATDVLTLLGGTMVAIPFGLAIHQLSIGAPPRWKLAIILFIAIVRGPPDALFYSMIFVSGLCVIMAYADAKQKPEFNLQRFLAITVQIIPLGLLPIIKGSFLVSSLLTLVICSFYLILKKKFFPAFLICVVPLIAMATFWSASGQSPLGLENYIISMIPIIFGYSDAMNSDGNAIEIILFILTSVVMVSFVIKRSALSVFENFFLGTIFLSFLFLSFKGGFVRHDAHAIVAGSAVLMAALIVPLVIPGRAWYPLVALASVSWLVIDAQYIPTSSRSLLENFGNTYASAWTGLTMRANNRDWPGSQFNAALKSMKEEAKLPVLSGTTDIYSYEQAALIASGNTWSPRPVFQSYSAYTPFLAELNREHLIGQEAPDNVFFRLQPIDGRIPSLDDGPSLPALLQHYQLMKLLNDTLILKNRGITEDQKMEETLKEGTATFDDPIIIPDAHEPLFVELKFESTILGKIANLLFRSEQLEITINLKTGDHRNYRIISKMAEAGFIISPLLENTEDFGSLFLKDSRLGAKDVQSFSISSYNSGSNMWADKFSFSIRKIPLYLKSDTLTGHETDHNLKDANGTTARIAEKCLGNIDQINGATAPRTADAAKVLVVNGWVAGPTEQANLPDEVLIALKPQSGPTVYGSTHRIKRPDVGAYFKIPEMENAGFETNMDLSGLEGTYTLGLAVEKNGIVSDCREFSIPVTIHK